jgi:hypothetical protein
MAQLQLASMVRNYLSTAVIATHKNIGGTTRDIMKNPNGVCHVPYSKKLKNTGPRTI